jgi:queuosine precursor transporter
MMVKDILSNKSTKLFIILGGFFIANALIAEIMGAKIFSLEKTLGLNPVSIPIFGHSFSFNLTAGVILWPIVFIMTDIINEYYGIKGVRFLSIFTVILIVFAFLLFQLAIQVHPADFWETGLKDKNMNSANAAYKSVLGQSQWIIVGSIFAFLLGQIIDVYVFHKIKKVTGEKSIWFRATGSTAVSQFIDSFVVLFIAFYIGPRISNDINSAISFSLVMSICVGNYLYKLFIAIIMTPIIYAIHHLIEKYLGIAKATEMKQMAMRD